MTQRARELEMLAMTMFAAVPLYATQAIATPPLAVFHLVMLGIAIRVAMGKGPELIPSAIMRGLAVAYIVFYAVDAAFISRNAIAASTHLVLFIATYQPIESVRTRNRAQRLLTTSLIFLASIATATHILILPFVVAFTFLMFRQLMLLSHEETARLLDRRESPLPSNRAAAFYLAGTTVVGMLLFPVLPRIRNPILPGVAGGLTNASTGLSESIDFNQTRSSSADPAVVARVWMGPEAIPFFTPLRLRGAIYDRFRNNEWRAARREWMPIDARDGVARVARPLGLTRRAIVQQRLVNANRLFLPVGTYEITGLAQVVESPTRDVFMAYNTRADIINYDVQLARAVAPLRKRNITVANYPVSPAVAQFARQLAANTTTPHEQAVRIENYLSNNFKYVADPARIGRRPMTVDEFLLKERRGHCEYFAAGMVALMTALDVPARIVGGFYGGQLNPLTGYFVIRRQDAHAWVEVWNGTAWETFDPTPPTLRPGNAQQGLFRAYASAVGDSVTYFWDRYVLTFGMGDQIALAVEMITNARDAAQRLRAGAAASAQEVFTARFLMLIVLVLAIGVVLIVQQRRRRPIAEHLREHLRRLGVDMSDAMTMEDALRRLRLQNPAAAESLQPLVALYEEERFSNRADTARAASIRRALRELRA